MRLSLYSIFVTLWCLVPLAKGQSVPTAKQELDQAARKLEQARGMAAQLPTEITEAAKSAISSPELKNQALDTAKALLPEAKNLLKPDSENKPTRSKSANSAARVTESVDGPVAQILPSLPASTAKSGVPTVIIEADSSVFDLNGAVFIYTGRVRARHPQFYIECDELVLEMVKPPEDTNSAANKPEKPAPKAESSKSDEKKDSGIKKAIATGATVTIEKLSEEGDTQIGKCRKAVYDGLSGEIVMSNFPQVQKGNILHVATQPDTLMIFDQKGSLRTVGRPRTIILNDAENKKMDAAKGNDDVR